MKNEHVYCTKAIVDIVFTLLESLAPGHFKIAYATVMVELNDHITDAGAARVDEEAFNRALGVLHALTTPVTDLCGARSWRGRTCRLYKHDAPHHEAADGTRWMGDARESANGTGLPDAVRRPYLALVEMDKKSRDECSEEEQAEWDVYFKELGDALFEACEITAVTVETTKDKSHTHDYEIKQ